MTNENDGNANQCDNGIDFTMNNMTHDNFFDQLFVDNHSQSPTARGLSEISEKDMEFIQAVYRKKTDNSECDFSQAELDRMKALHIEKMSSAKLLRQYGKRFSSDLFKKNSPTNRSSAVSPR